MEFSPGDPCEIFELICEHFHSPESVRAFSKKLVCGVWENRAYLDKKIRQASKNWRLERMSKVDRSILRLGAFEVLFMEDIPPKVTMDEAVELGKRYGTGESGAFINGILDNIFNESRPENSKSP